MELTLSRQMRTQVAVACDNKPSHVVDLDTLIPDTEKGPPQSLQDPVTFGKAVYQALFPDGTPAQRALNNTPESILLVATDSDLDAVPWEYAYGPEGFLVFEYPFVRGLPVEQRIEPPVVDSSLHVVAIPSNPLDSEVPPLNIEGEWLRLKEIIEGVPYTITLERTRPPTIEQVRNLVANQRNRVLHFMGHGGQQESGAVLFFEKENGELDRVTAKQFTLRVRGTVFLATLNACVSAAPGETAFSNLAWALVRQKTPYALGMRLSIDDEDARTFSRTFYSDLARGSPVEEALLQARLTLAASPRPWVIGVPVLYTALIRPAAGFTSITGTPTVQEHQPPLEVSALPRAEGAFQGRIDELRHLGSDLTGDRRSRIVTIHGGGGQGKTALAREAVERFAHAWPGGIWAASLENLPSRERFVVDLARFLGIATQEILDLTEVERQIMARLVHRRTLIVLDNAENMIEAVEAKNAAAIQLAQFVQQLAGPSVSLLATSRVQLQWSEEVSHQLSGLSPDEGAALFRQSAPQRAGDIDMALAQQLSKKVDGHPLSLRLLGGAFNASIISLPAFFEAYEARLLTAENKYVEVEHRHRTLYASIETSVRYLGVDLRNLFSGLSIFHAPFMDQSAVGIFDPDTEDSEEIPSHIRDDLHTLWLRGLLERRKMIVRDTTLMFYYLSPTTRPYVEHHLEQAYEREKLLSRFALTYFSLVVWLYQNLDSTSTASVIAQQAREDLERAASFVPEEGQGKYQTCWGWIQYRLGNPQSALKLLESALELAQGTDQDLEAVTMTSMATVYRDMGQPQEARRLYQQALSIERKISNPKEEATTLYQLGRVYDDTGQPQEALQLYEQTLTIKRKVGDRVGEAVILNDMAGIYNRTGRTQEALQLYNESLSILTEENHWGGVATTLDNIATICSSLGMPKKALEFYEQALPIRREVGDRLGEAATLASIAHTHLLLGQPQEALRLHQQALLIQKEIMDQTGQARTLTRIAEVYHWTGQQQDALRLCQQALAIAQQIGDRESEASALKKMAEIYHAIGKPQKALEIYELALGITKELGNLAKEAGVLSGIANVYHDIGRSQEALELFGQSLSISTEIGH
jgi:tetratricopeptide (TPR) repeat protein